MTLSTVPIKEHFWQKFEGSRELYDICWNKLIKEIPNLPTREFDYDDVSFFRDISQRLDEFADNTTEKDYDPN